MPNEREDAGTDPGLAEEGPSEEEWAKEEEARAEISVADLVELDLSDPTTPSRRGSSGDPEPGSFDVPLRERSRGLSNGG